MRAHVSVDNNITDSGCRQFAHCCIGDATQTVAEITFNAVCAICAYGQNHCTKQWQTQLSSVFHDPTMNLSCTLGMVVKRLNLAVL